MQNRFNRFRPAPNKHWGTQRPGKKRASCCARRIQSGAASFRSPPFRGEVSGTFFDVWDGIWRLQSHAVTTQSSPCEHSWSRPRFIDWCSSGHSRGPQPSSSPSEHPAAAQLPTGTPTSFPPGAALEQRRKARPPSRRQSADLRRRPAPVRPADTR